MVDLLLSILILEVKKMKRFNLVFAIIISLCICGLTSDTSKLMKIEWQKNNSCENILFKFNRIPKFMCTYENFPSLIRLQFYSTSSTVGLPSFKQSKLALQPWCMFALPTNDGLELCVVFSRTITYKITKDSKTNTIILSIQQKDDNVIPIYSIRTKSFIDFDDNDIITMKNGLENLCGHKVRIIPGELFSVVIDVEQFYLKGDAKKRFQFLVDNTNPFDLIVEYRNSNALPRCILAKGQDFDDEND